MGTGTAHDTTMSIIVPVFNKVAYLDTCLSSLEAQTADKGAFEVLLIDDGSNDGSLEKCLAFEQSHPNAKVISQKNQGVSVARNVGIRQAEGDIFLFLDADDSISPETVVEICSLFEEHGDEFDVATYPLRYHNAILGTVTDHPRARWFKGTGAYPLEDNPYIAQATMNICVRNRGADNILFDVGMRTCEDQLYITRNLERKAVLGYNDNACYSYYAIGTGGAIQRLANPLYTYDEMLTLFRYLLELAESNEAMSRYAYALILYNVDWRLRSNRLFPLHLDGEEREQADRELDAILGAIPHKPYAASPYLNAHHKAYFLDRYAHQGQNASVEHTPKKTYVTFEDESTWGTAQAKIVIEQCLLYDGTLGLRGRVTCPAFRFEDKPLVRFSVDGRVEDVELAESSFSYANTKIPIGRIWWLEHEVEVPSGRGSGEVRIELVVDGNPVACELEMNLRFCNARLVEGVYHFPQMAMTVSENALLLEKVGALRRKKDFFSADRHDEEARLARNRAREFANELGEGRIWLYADCPASATTGDALLQLLHDISMDDGVERYYISDHEEEVLSRYPELAGRIIPGSSDRHKMLSLFAEACLYSGVEGSIRHPNNREDLAVLGDYQRDQKTVFLNNGVLHAIKPWRLSRDRLLADAVVVSTKREAELLATRYGYAEGNLVSSGLPRFDTIGFSCAEGGRKILYAPSWRSYLLVGSGRDWYPADRDMKGSSFYGSVKGLVSSFNESCVLGDRGYSLDIKLHENFGCYVHLFEDLCSESVRIVTGDVDAGDYEVAVTDYSSIAYDLAYAGCKIVYFHPDCQEFRAGLHEYREIDPPLTSGFGPLCTAPEEAIAAIEAAVGEDAPEASGNREKMCRDVFLHVDGENRRRIYQEVCERVGPPKRA